MPPPDLQLPVDAERAGAAADSLAQQYGEGVAAALGEGATDLEASAAAADDLEPAIERTASTEAVDAWNDETAVLNEGLVALPGVRIVQVWQALLDTRTCPSCSAMDGQMRRWPERFEDEPPLHPRCRCFLSTYLDEVVAA